MVSKNLSVGIQFVIPLRHWYLVGRYLKVRESLHTQVIIWLDTILDHIDTRSLYISMKVFLHGIEIQMVSKTKILSNIHTLLVSKICEILIIDTQMV